MRHIILLLFLSSCSANWHLRQAIAKDPTLLETRTVDTLVVTERVVTDSLVLTNSRDTVTIVKDRLTVRVERSFDTLRIFGECAPDTVRVAVECPPSVGLAERPKWLGVILVVMTVILGLLILIVFGSLLK